MSDRDAGQLDVPRCGVNAIHIMHIQVLPTTRGGFLRGGSGGGCGAPSRGGRETFSFSLRLGIGWTYLRVLTDDGYDAKTSPRSGGHEGGSADAVGDK